MSTQIAVPLRQRRCTALRRRLGTPCGAPAHGGDRCWTHGGASVGYAKNPLSLTLDGGTPVLWHSDEAGTKLGAPRVCSKWAAIQYTLRGVVRNGFFLVDNKDRRAVVERFIRRIERSGARCIPLPSKGPVCHYRFEAPESQEEKPNT